MSGAASLLFETLWFRLSGIVFGNSAWASAIVLAAFMAGLAIGNALSMKLPRGAALRAYSALEFTIGISGLLLVLILPHLSQLLAPLFRALLDSAMLNAVRLAFAFVLLVIPASVMGATLPAMVSALTARDENFGRVLGLLYGCNTVGAVVGALAGELVLVRAFGVRGTGTIAALVSITAAVAALECGSLLPPSEPPRRRQAAALHDYRPLVAAFASGFALLALEVIWFRFVILFVMSTSLSFAVMLAVVLAGIALGALAASAILGNVPDADRFTPVLAAAAVVALIVSYAGFEPHAVKYLAVAVVRDSVRLMFPVSLISGALFTFIGRAVERQIGDEMRAAALTTFANTIGAALGPLVAGFVMIPTIGVERSFFVIASLYGAIALLTMRADVPRRAIIAAGAVAVLALAFFPFHLFVRDFLPEATREFRDSQIVAVREGPIETAVYLRRDYDGEPYVYRLFTNGYSMSATTFASKRYMSDFVYLPLALRPHARNALLISYGVGVTAKRLTEAQQIASIDVVDISRTILDLSGIVWPGRSNPLADPRVRVHVEDGRFFLLATKQRFDLITAEPPPPKSAGIVNLYTREHFRLMRDRLSEQGIASYWLPAYQMTESENKAIIRAFCDVFTDCSLWNGGGAEWILIGGRGAWSAPSYDEFSQQWRTSDHLQRLGIESPEQMGATFLADAAMLRRITADAPPLTDDHPLRLSPRPVREIAPFIFAMMENAPAAFAQSEFVRAALPDEVRQGAPRFFGVQRLLDRVLLLPSPNGPPPPALVKSVLTTTSSRVLPLLLFGSDPWVDDIAMRARARGDRSPSIAYVLAVAALSDRDYKCASALFAEAGRGLPMDRELRDYQTLADTLSR